MSSQKHSKFLIFFNVIIAVSFTIVIYGFAISVIDSVDIAWKIITQVCLPYLLFGYINIYIHEFGHAYAGLLVGFSINRINIGIGKEIFRKDLGKFLLVITNSFNGGLTYLDNVSKKHLKIRYLIFIAGGIVSQILAVLITMIVFRISINDLITIADISLANIFIYSNLFMILVNIVPCNTKLGGVLYPNDGLQIIKTLFLSQGGVFRQF